MALGGRVGIWRTTDMVAWLWRTVWAPLAVQTASVPSLTLHRPITIDMLLCVSVRAGAVAVCVVGFALQREGVRSGQNSFCGHEHLAVVAER